MQGKANRKVHVYETNAAYRKLYDDIREWRLNNPYAGQMHAWYSIFKDRYLDEVDSTNGLAGPLGHWLIEALALPPVFGDERAKHCGQFFHRAPWVDGRTSLNQGQILSLLPNGSYLVQMYSYLDGGPSTREEVEPDEIARWWLYDDSRMWRRMDNERQTFCKLIGRLARLAAPFSDELAVAVLVRVVTGELPARMFDRERAYETLLGHIERATKSALALQ